MASKRKGLGRGLDALLSGHTINNVHETIEEVQSSELAVDEQLKYVPVELIQRGKYQPRRDINPDTLEELAESIKAQGVMQPIVIRPVSKDKYEIIAGERRWRASQLVGLDKIPAVVRHVPDEAAIAMALIENIQRENLNPLEEAIALKRLQDEFELTHQQVAEAVGKSRTAVTNLLRLIALDNGVKKLLEYGDIEMGHARAILSLDAPKQCQIANEVVAKNLSVRQTEALVRRVLESKQQVKQGKVKTSDLQKLEEGLSEKVGVPVMLQHNAKGKGKLILKYNNLDELDGILSHLNYTA
ncbi:chromosome partitioning protein ParB [Candidatus Endobugula sertula]|uniref:Probable chromosome-partitioning protein ParB n=1 Tax=Candidatus Endobugula sertula TaxID=62101 RepID=A0A1D2QNM5_9GAMM|nr:chromosome partitioning protein ParB [Candidatus Endobugula sertula]